MPRIRREMKTGVNIRSRWQLFFFLLFSERERVKPNTKFSSRFFSLLSPFESVSTDFASVGKFIARLNECKPTAWDVSVNLYTVFLFVVIEETCFTSSKTLSVGDSVPLNSTIKMCLANCQKTT